MSLRRFWMPLEGSRVSPLVGSRRVQVSRLLKEAPGCLKLGVLVFCALRRVLGPSPGCL